MFPFAGATIFYQGSILNIPSGWQLSDGTNGTKDLRDKFILCSGTSYAAESTGGVESVTLSLTQIPAHYHTQKASLTEEAYGYAGGSGQKNLSTQTVGATGGKIETASAGGGQSHNNMPPYYALAVIVYTQQGEQQPQTILWDTTQYEAFIGALTEA